MPVEEVLIGANPDLFFFWLFWYKVLVLVVIIQTFCARDHDADSDPT